MACFDIGLKVFHVKDPDSRGVISEETNEDCYNEDCDLPLVQVEWTVFPKNYIRLPPDNTTSQCCPHDLKECANES